jgi:hypothetical protein
MLKTKLTWEGRSIDECLSLFDEQHQSSISLQWWFVGVSGMNGTTFYSIMDRLSLW